MTTEMHTILEIIKKTTDFLASKGIESPRLNAELLVGRALERKRMQLYLEFERPLTEAELERIRPLVRRRAQHEPLQYVVGEEEFHGLMLKVDRRVLIPRPETELLVEMLLAAVRERGTPALRVLELGTGSGAIACALARAWPDATVVATDVSTAALEVASVNAAANAVADRMQFVVSDWWAAVPAGPYDVIVSNPPYLTPEETAGAAREVRDYEPHLALTSGRDGMDALRVIAAGVSAYLRPGGVLALETGIEQHAELTRLLTAAGFAQVDSKRDLTGRDRFILAVL